VFVFFVGKNLSSLIHKEPSIAKLPDRHLAEVCARTASPPARPTVGFANPGIENLDQGFKDLITSSPFSEIVMMSLPSSFMVVRSTERIWLFS